MSDAVRQPPILYSVWVPRDLLAGCQPFLERSGYSLQKPCLLFPYDPRKRLEYRLFEQGSAAADLRVEVVLTEESAEKTSEYRYIYMEPLTNIVIALGYAERKASITADAGLWISHEPELMTLRGDAERLLQQGEIIEPLVISIRMSRQILQSR